MTTHERERERMARQRRQMARPVISRHPDETFSYADDSLRLTWAEFGRMLVGLVVFTAFVVVVAFAMSLGG